MIVQCPTFPEFDMNGRLTKSTSARAWTGYDEIVTLLGLASRFVGPDS